MKLGNFAIVWDWDDVIFNTAAFKKSIANELAKQGVSRRVVLETFAIAKDKRGYNPRVHARMVQKKIDSAHAGITEKLIWDACRSLAKELLFPDAVRVLRSAARTKIPMYVLSAGRRQFQQAKISGSGLEHLFRQVHIVDVTDLDAAAATKIRVLGELARRHRTLLFLDDRPKNIEAIERARSLRGKVVSVLVWRARGKPPAGLRAVRRLDWKPLKKIAIPNHFE